MRAIVLAIVAIQLGLGLPAYADDPPASERSLNELLPLFEKNHCAGIADPADQLFCGDPELQRTSGRLAVAVEARLSRLPNRRVAIEENAQWIKNRNSSCGIFGAERVRNKDVPSVKACLLTETEERIAILSDPNFDCLTSNSTAGMLICSDPSLALPAEDLNKLVLALIGKLDEHDASDAFEEYARWIRARDRKCNLQNKANVPLEELEPSAACLGEYLTQKTTEMIAANGNPKRVFGRHLPAPSPDADAVDQCVAQIHSANTCGNFLAVSRVIQLDREVAQSDARVMAEVEMTVLSPFTVCSPIALNCTGTCWDSKMAAPNPGVRERVRISQRLLIRKSFSFQKADGGWRCDTAALQPVETGAPPGRP